MHKMYSWERLFMALLIQTNQFIPLVPSCPVLLRLQMSGEITLDFFFSVFLWFVSNMFGFHGMFASCDVFK